MKSSIFLVLAGCLNVPKGPHPACTASSDCNTAAGEVCEEGVCWGNPPAGPFAATLGPPSDRADIVSTEMPTLAVPPTGWLGDLALDTPVTISGRVEAFCALTMCEGASIGASILVTRPSLFPGGPGFRAVATSKPGIARGSDSFALQVPRTSPSDPPYALTIVPDGNTSGPPPTGSAPAEQSPPMRVTLPAADNLSRTFTLGGDTSQVITGNLSDGTGHPLVKYKVVAMGALEAGGTPTVVSSVAYTTTGQFSLTLADGIAGNVELVASPFDPNVVAPTLHLYNVPPTTATHTIAQPANLGNRVDVTVPVHGVGGDGAVAPVSAARVIVTGRYDPPLNAGASAELVVEAATGDDGLAHLTLLDGLFAASYKLRVVPPPSSSLGVIYDDAFSFDVSQKEVRLPTRLALRGRVVDTAGNPLGDVSITAHPSQRFTWSLDAKLQQFLPEIPASTTISPATGDFVVWVDPLVGGVWGYYDLQFEMPVGSPEPNWTRSDIEAPRPLTQSTYSLGDVMIPDASNVHGRLVDGGAVPVAGGELRVFQIITNTALCSEVAHAPPVCVIPAQLLGHGTSDDQGVVRFTLPRP